MTQDEFCDGLCSLWAEALGIDKVGPDEDFFDLGGNSITAVRMLKEIKSRYGVGPGAAVIFDNPTPRELAAALTATTARR
jgi:acyl carrier protein